MRHLRAHFPLLLLPPTLVGAVIGVLCTGTLSGACLVSAGCCLAAVWGRRSTKHALVEHYRELSASLDAGEPEETAPLSESEGEEIDELVLRAAKALYNEQRSSKLEEQHRALKDRYELVTNNIAASVIMYGADNSVQFFSPYTQVLTGLSPLELEAMADTGQDVFEGMVVSEDLERYQRARAVSALGEEMLVRFRIRHRSGLRLWLESQMVPVCNEEGEVTSVMSVTIDVTDSLSYQEQIEEQNRDLSDFAYMVSHDLKAPIFTIKGMANALLEDFGPRLEDGREMIEYIVDGARRLEELVASVIEYSAIATKEVKESDIDVSAVLANVQADLAEQIRQKAAAVQIQPARLPMIRGDEIRVYQVFSNLLGNALKYSSPERPPQIRVAGQRTGAVVVITVEDNGVGIPEARLGDIFRPYHRAHGPEIEGSGIGLACVKKLVERMGGTVAARSIEGEGSIFTVTFPAATTPRELPEELARLY